VDEVEGCGTPERRSDDNAIYKPMEEAEIYDVPHKTSAKTPQLKRPSESYTTGVPTKQVNKEKLHELNNELNYATKPMLDEPMPNEPMEMVSHSSDSFEVRRNVKVKVDIHLPPITLKRMHGTEKINIKDKNPSQSQNIEDFEVIEEEVPIEERIDISADTDDRNINYEVDKNLLKYREPKMPNDETSSGKDTDKIFSPTAYKAKTKP